MAEAEPTVFNGRYEVERKLARGGMADVYLARDALLDRRVALKVLFSEFATDPTFVERFRREAQSAANLSHPNVVSVYDWGEEDGTYFIVMEYVEGQSLAQILRADGPLSPDRAADITIDVASALGFAHRNGVIHRDVKPGNVLIAPTGEVKVADFGIARAVSTDENLTQTGTVMGTATYFSPEQAKGEAVDARSDVYSLGIVLYEMVGGTPPFSGDNPISVAYKHVQEPVPLLTGRNADIPSEIEAVAHKALAKNPANRYDSADDMAADLRRFRAGRPVEAEGVLAPPLDDATSAMAGGPTAATRAVPGYAGEGTSVVRTVDDDNYRGGEPPRRSAAFIGVLIALLALLALLLFLFARNLGDDATQVEVPSVISLTQPDAVEVLEGAGFEVDTDQERNPDFPEGEVFAQDPAAGEVADEGSTVNIIVSSGQEPVEVPDVVGDPEDEARALIEGLGLEVDARNDFSEDVAEGLVISQSPAAGEELPPGSAVVIVVSEGADAVAVPDVIGMNRAQATDELEEAGFVVEVVEEEDDATENTVFRTDPEPDTEAERGSTVRVFVSTGPPETTTTTSTTTTTVPVPTTPPTTEATTTTSTSTTTTTTTTAAQQG